MHAAHQNRPIVIAHRGASGYLPEHTLPAKAMAYALGADYLEQDVVLSRDRQAIVLHDIHLDEVTDVAARFPGRHRADGRFYAIDFSLAEMRQLQVHERIDRETRRAVFERRFPVGNSVFSIPTLAEEIELIQGMNKSTGREVGIYPEIKAPAFHRSEGLDISQAVLAVLAEYGYVDREDAVFLQCFDIAELRRIREELDCQLKLVQLIGENSWADARGDHDQLRTEAGLKKIAEYAEGIGPRIEHLMDMAAGRPMLRSSPLVEQARRHGLLIHPFTFRTDALPENVGSAKELLAWLFGPSGLSIDGVFTDFPDVVAQYIRS